MAKNTLIAFLWCALNCPCDILLDDHLLAVIALNAVRVLRHDMRRCPTMISSEVVPWARCICRCSLGLARKWRVVIGSLAGRRQLGHRDFTARPNFVAGSVIGLFLVEGAVVSGKARNEPAKGGDCGSDDRKVYLCL